MEPAPEARLLDLTRLVSRLGRGALTGVDRVELAYLTHLLAGPVALFGLVRTALGFVLLDAAGCKAVALRAQGAVELGPSDLLGRLTRRGMPLRARAEADLRKLALARCTRPLLARMIRRHLPGRFSYLNVGHANLSDRVMRAMGSARKAVLVHDAIPLDYPEYTRAGMAAVFARKLGVVSRRADLVIYSSHDARARVEAHMGRVPPAVVAGLGVPMPVVGKLPEGLDVSSPYYVVIGTIEPRKNHALLLDVWQKLPDTGPKLFILGSRGWGNDAVFARLDSAPMMGRTVFEVPRLEDGQVAALLQNAQALLFPSFAEGYGLPLFEAKALGVPVFASNLAVFHQIIGDYPVYLDPTSSYSWLETIAKNSQADRRRARNRQYVLGQNVTPTWDDHFKSVLTIV